MASKNYRKTAFDNYAPICAYCGFSIRDILEVCHIDGNHNNNKLDNLVILCPTCHRMLDVDIISNKLIKEIRDRSKKANWNKLTKNAHEKALATMRKRKAIE